MTILHSPTAVLVSYPNEKVQFLRMELVEGLGACYSCQRKTATNISFILELPHVVISRVGGDGLHPC